MSFQSLVIGIVHLFFGFSVLCLQVACYLIQAYYYQDGLFEGYFHPGSWLGSFILITGILGIVHGCLHGSADAKTGRHVVLRRVVIIFNVLVAILSMVMLGLAVGFWMLDPEISSYDDCIYPFAPWIYYYQPHCEVSHKVKIFGATMMAVACFEVIFGFGGAVIIRRSDQEWIRRG